MNPRLHAGWVTSADGTRLATYEAGPRDRPVLLLANGLGGNVTAWDALVERFAGRFRIVSWDYRGLFRSFGPPSGDHALDRHCDDLDAVIQGLEVRRALVLGWSMGVQVSLQAWRRRPGLFAGMVLIDGTWGRPLTTGFTADWVRAAAPAWLEAMRHAGPLVSALGPAVLRSGAFLAAARALGVVSPTLDTPLALEVALDFCRLDMEAFVRTFRGMDAHDAWDVLPTVSVPALVMAGDRDLFTPPEVARRLAARIPGAELQVVRGGTHYLPLEFPAAVNQRLERFLRDRLPGFEEGTDGVERGRPAGAEAPRAAIGPAKAPAVSRRARPTRPAGGGRSRKA